MALQTPTVGIQDPNLAGQLGGIGDTAIQLQQANQRSASDIAAEQDLITSQIPTAQAARREQLADLVAKAQIRRNTRSLFPEDATEFQLNLAQRYQEVTGRMPPINAQTGQVDFGAMNSEMARLADERMKLEMMKVTGRGGAGQLSAAETVKAQDAIADADDQLTKLQRVKALIADKSVNAVGPVRGTTVGQKAAQAQAVAPGVLGGDAGATYNKQRELEMWTNEQVISRSEKMKGQLSDKDIKFLVQSVPKLSDTEEVWNRFFDVYEKSLNIAKRNAQLRAAGQLTGEPPSELAPPDGTEVPASAAPPASEVGVFSDDELTSGQLLLKDGQVHLKVGGVAKRIGRQDLIRMAGLRGKQSTAVGPGVAVSPDAPVSVGDIPVTAGQRAPTGLPFTLDPNAALLRAQAAATPGLNAPPVSLVVPQALTGGLP